MWYPPWFDSFESWVLSATCGVAISCFLILVRIHDALRRIEKDLHERSEGNRKDEVDQDSRGGERDV